MAGTSEGGGNCPEPGLPRIMDLPLKYARVEGT